MIALVYPGQGVAPPWVSADVITQPAVRELVEVASEATKVNVLQLLQRGGRELGRTEILQPAMVAVSLGVTRLLGIRAAIVSGHSLGELAAWAASGAISYEAAVVAAAVRGRLMADAAARSPGGMIALRDPGTAICERALALGGLYLAANNAPEEFVLSGDSAAIARVAASFSSIPLPVGGPWHSPAMLDAVPELARTLRAIPRQPGIPLVANRDGLVAEDDAIPELLAEQLVRPIAWVTAQHTLAEKAQRWIVVGRGSTIRGFARRTVPQVEIEIVDSMREIDRIGVAA